MAKQTEMDIEIDAEGQVHVHVKGAKGKACMEYMKIIEEVLGRATDKQYTSEYYEEVRQSVRQSIQAKTRRKED